MRVLYLGAHSILEYDEVRLLSDLGHDVLSIGAYLNPQHPSDDKRPPLPNVTYHPELEALVPDHMAAKAHLPDDLIDWADCIIFAAYQQEWIPPQWPRIRNKRVIWRTIGQSSPDNEDVMAMLHRDGMEVVRYSPKERQHFEAIGHFGGETAMIRFGKYLDDYPQWVGGDYVANVTQDMAGRGEWCGLSFYLEATKGLNAKPAGPFSEKLPGGVGTLSYPDLLAYLQHAGAYLYTGTVPASYTLGLIEAMAVGVPVVCMPAELFMVPPLFEAPEIVDAQDGPRHDLRWLLGNQGSVNTQVESQLMRQRAAALFGVSVIAPQWQALLGPVGNMAHDDTWANLDFGVPTRKLVAA